MRTIVTLIVLAVFAMLLLHGCSTYNTFVEQEENVENSWGKVQSAYQRRADLIPNLVATVKGVAEFEKETLTGVVEARAKATQMQIDPSNLSAEQIKEFQATQGQLSQALGRLLLVQERYPELKANQSFLELQSQLEGTENRINVERNNFNDVVTSYNKSVRRFPSKFYASMFGFSEKPQFQADPSAQNTPKVEF